MVNLTATTSFYVVCYNTAQDCESDPRQEALGTIHPIPTIVANGACDGDNLTYTITVTTTNADELTSDVGTVSGTAPNFTVSGITVGTAANLTANNTTTTCTISESVTSPVCSCPAGSPSVTGDERCGPGDVTLGATSGVNCDEIRWYDALTGGSLVHTGTSYMVNLTTTTSFYVVCYNTAQDCESDPRQEALATIHPIPTIVANGACDGDNLTYTITVTTTNADELTSDVGTVSGTAPNFTVSGITVGAAANLTANNTTTTCSISESVTSPVCSCPAGSPSVTGDERCGPGDVTLRATSGVNCDEIRWYDMSVGGVIVNTGTNYDPSLTETTSYWLVCYNTSQDCESEPRQEVIGTINPLPTIMANGACDADNLSYTITVTTTDADQLTSDFGTVTGAAPNWTVTGINVGTDVILTATNSTTSCSTSEMVDSPTCSCPAGSPMTSSDQRCGEGVVNLTAQSGANCDEIRWYDMSSGGTVVNTGTTYDPDLSNTMSFWVVCYNTSQDCESDPRQEVMGIIDPIPTIMATGACDADNLTYSITVTTTHSDDLTSDSGMVSGAAPNWTVSDIPVGTNVMITATNTASTCSASEMVESPSCSCAAGTPVITNDERCGEGIVNLSATNGANCDEIRWYDMLAGGTVVNTGNNYDPDIDVTTSYWVVCYNTSQDCESEPRQEVIGTINPLPTIMANGGCNMDNLTYTITASTTDADELTSDVGTVGGAAPNWTISGIAVGTNAVLTATNTTSNCSTTESVESPSCSCAAGSPMTMSDQRCGEGTVNLTAVSGANCDEIRWYNMEIGGTVVNTGTSYDPNINTTTSYWVVCYNTDQDCESDPRQEVMGIIDPNPTILATSNCEMGNASYSITVTTTNSDQLTSDAGTVSGAAPNWTVSGINIGSTVTVTATNSTSLCTTNETVLSPTCSCQASSPVTTGDQRCAEGEVNLTAMGDANCDELRWYDMSTGGVIVNTGSSYDPIITQTTSYWVVCYNSSQDCESESRQEVIGTVNPMPTVMANGACDADNLNYTITIITTDSDELTSNVGTVSGSAPNWTVSGIMIGVDAVLTINNSVTGCSINETVISPMCSCPAGSPMTTGDERCGEGTVDLSAISGANCDEIRWYDSSTNGTMVNTGENFSPSLAISTSYWLVCYNSAQDCESDPRQEVRGIINPIPTILAAGACESDNLNYTITATTTNADVLTSDVGTVSGAAPNWTISGIPVGQSAILTATNSSTLCNSIENVSSPACACPAGNPIASGDERCGEGIVNLVAQSGANCDEIRWYDNSSGGNVVNVGSNFNPDLSVTTSYWVVCYNTAQDCESEERQEVEGIINPVPSMTITTSCDADYLNYTINVTTINSDVLASNIGTISGAAPNWTISGIPLGFPAFIFASSSSTNCTTEESVMSPICIEPCSLVHEDVFGECHDSGTNTDTSDDHITFVLNPTGISLGTSYTVSSVGHTVSTASGLAVGVNYGSPITFQLENGTAGNGNVTITISDDEDPSCTIDVLVVDPGVCLNCPSPNCFGIKVTKSEK